ncbi:sel1 repeat family protein [Micromonospora phytophila]|uniref:tetratricopeptide repeat protein n=1 Tax=Micromonospora phytophila TaxID=709888 RepID=UPI00202F8458|nr:tetratricopeptide repeat protein [Micromonospora phytophila]MCM0674804.1 sel1 repeat family protein [Micromonospora phytophila]
MSKRDEMNPRERARGLLAVTGGDVPLVTDREVKEVKRSLLPMARAGDLEAQSLLGAIELEIEGKPKAARGWFESAAQQGDAVAKRSLGHLYANGLGVRQDLAKAVRLFREAAADGDPYAMFNLAALNDRADGAYATFEETLRLLEGAAKAGIPVAVSKLGDMLARVDRDEEAVECYVKAAELGHAGAMYTLGCWARDGIGGPRDNVQAVRWFLRMVAAGDNDGIQHGVKLVRTMSAEDVRQAARLAGRPDLGEALLMTTSGRRPGPGLGDPR